MSASNREIRIRVVQPAAGPLDPESAMSLIADAIRSASGHADLLVLPELATTQYDIRHHIGQIAPALDSEQFTELRELARQAHLVAVVGLVEVEDSALYNSAAVIDADGSLAGVVRKSHLFAGERKVFAAGSTISPIPTRLGQLGVAICYDIEFPEVARTLALASADMLVVLSANMHPYTDYHLTYAKSRAMENGIPLALSNWVGQGPRFDFLGRSCIVTAQGQIVADAGSGPGHVDAVVILGDPTDPDLDYLAHRRPTLYS